MPEWLGKSIGKVRIDKLLARGGMAEVYLGSHLTLERLVAVKVLHSFVEEEPLLIERFHREAKVVAGLRHPHIVQIFDFDTIDGHPYIVMEYLKGPTLATYLRHLHQRNRRIPSDQVARLLRELSSALDYAHGQGVVHRDIKPGNIMLLSKADDIPLDRPLTDDVEIVITDFGLVRIMNTASQTMSGTVSGTPAYMSPEQARGDQLDQSTDIYSLGVVLYEMLAGRVPFEADSTLTVLHMQIHAPPPPIQGIPAKLQAVIDRALAKKPEDRYQTARELAADYSRSVGMSAPAEVAPEPAPVNMDPIKTSVVAETEPSPIVIAPEPSPKQDATMAAPSKPRPTEAELLSKPAPVVQETPPTPKPKPTEPEPRPRSARTAAWMGLGLVSLVVISLVGAWALGLFSPKLPQPTATLAPTPSISPSESPTLATADHTNMVQIPAGTYEVGTTEFQDDYHASPRKITLDSYWIDQYQVTNEQYQKYINGWSFPPGEEKHPARGVTWDQANAYCNGKNKRLPSEAEWEAAGRGSGENPPLYPWGPEPDKAQALPSDNTYEVGSQSLNVSPFKVYDMVGNVWEWVGELYESVPDGSVVLRGGRYSNPQDLAFRLHPVVSSRDIPNAGFRCAADMVK